MRTTDWILALLLGGLMGMLGQGVRVVSGLKKVHDQAAAEQRPFAELFELNTLLLSLLIGFVAGALAILSLSDPESTTAPSRDLVLSLLGVGYAGTDFIEAFMRKHLPGETGTPESGPVPGSEPPAIG